MSEIVTVLVVDDDPDVLEVVRAFLARHGYHVLTSTDPRQALELARHHPVALVVTDYMMPHVDGIAFTEQLHRLPGRADLPVLLMTAYASDHVADMSLRRGVALTLPKPIDFGRLLTLVGFATGGAPPAQNH